MGEILLSCRWEDGREEEEKSPPHSGHFVPRVYGGTRRRRQWTWEHAETCHPCQVEGMWACVLLLLPAVRKLHSHPCAGDSLARVHFGPYATDSLPLTLSFFTLHRTRLSKHCRSSFSSSSSSCAPVDRGISCSLFFLAVSAEAGELLLHVHQSTCRCLTHTWWNKFILPRLNFNLDKEASEKEVRHTQWNRKRRVRQHFQLLIRIK